MDQVTARPLQRISWLEDSNLSVIQAVTFSSPNVGGHLTIEKGPFNHPKKGPPAELPGRWSLSFFYALVLFHLIWSPPSWTLEFYFFDFSDP